MNSHHALHPPRNPAGRSRPAGRAPVSAEWLSHTLTTLAARHQVPGVQVAVHSGGCTVTAQAGELEHGGAAAVSRHTAFPIGSITKAFTAAVAMILVADDDLELDAPVGEYLPELRGGSGLRGAELTLRQLLSHTSGLVSGPDSATVAALSARRYVMDHCRNPALLMPPGTGFSYSNAGYVLVGCLIEATTGMSWSEAVESILLRPLGIDPVLVGGAAAGRRPGRPLATGHSVGAAGGEVRIRPVQQSLAAAEAAVGGLGASALDLVHFGQLLCRGGGPDLLPAAYADQLRRVAPGADPFGLASGWGLGLALFEHGGQVWAGHDGNGDGTDCHFRINADSGTVVAFTSNANTGFGLWEELVGQLRRANVEIGDYAPAAVGTPLVPPTADLPAQCLGSYQNGDLEYTVTPEGDGGLCLVVDGDPASRLTVHADLVFTQRDWDFGRPARPGRFLRDPITGEVDRIQVSGRLARRRRPHI